MALITSGLLAAANAVITVKDAAGLPPATGSRSVGQTALVVCNNACTIAGTTSLPPDIELTLRCVNGEWDAPIPSCRCLG